MATDGNEFDIFTIHNLAELMKQRDDFQICNDEVKKHMDG